MEWFRNRREAAALIESFRVHYNKVRPHSSIGYLTPEEFRATERTPNNNRRRSGASPIILAQRSRAGQECASELATALNELEE
jgi:hypothetical protein